MNGQQTLITETFQLLAESGNAKFGKYFQSATARSLEKKTKL